MAELISSQPRFPLTTVIVGTSGAHRSLTAGSTRGRSVSVDDKNPPGATQEQELTVPTRWGRARWAAVNLQLRVYGVEDCRSPMPR